MKNRKWVIIFGLLVPLVLLKSKSMIFAEEASPAPIKITPEWQKKMQELYKTLVEMTVDTSSEKRFNDPKYKNQIEKNAKKLAEQAHDLTKKAAPPDSDPTLKILAALFQDETKRAYNALKSGKREYARSRLNQVTNYCFACHTRNSNSGPGPSFNLPPSSESTKNDLSPIEKGRFYAATGQYDRALDLFQKIANDPNGPIERPLEWEQAIRFGLTIAVRVKQDPDQARALAERVIGSKKAPQFLKETAKSWRDSIQKWKEEMPHRALTEEGLRVEAIEQMAQAAQIQKGSPMTHKADIQYLRATAVLHELLQKWPNGRYSQEALQMAGKAYEVLGPTGLDDLHDIYYEACIRKDPQTKTAEECYDSFEQSMWFEFGGSGGIYLPEDVSQKLQNLDNLIHPAKSVQKPLD